MAAYEWDLGNLIRLPRFLQIGMDEDGFLHGLIQRLAALFRVQQAQCAIADTPKQVCLQIPNSAFLLAGVENGAVDGIFS